MILFTLTMFLDGLLDEISPPSSTLQTQFITVRMWFLALSGSSLFHQIKTKDTFIFSISKLGSDEEKIFSLCPGELLQRLGEVLCACLDEHQCPLEYLPLLVEIIR